LCRKIRSAFFSLLTVMDGKVVFGVQDYGALSPELSEILPAWSHVKYFGSYYGDKGT
jgi:hypothetical protein